jgi:hypothetical protein
VIALFTNLWFPDNEVRIAAAILGLSIPGGNVVAFTLAGIVFKGADKASSEEIKVMLFNMITIQCVWITTITVFYFILAQEKPEYPPSLVALEPKRDVDFW